MNNTIDINHLLMTKTKNDIEDIIEKEGLKGFFTKHKHYPPSINFNYDIKEMKENLNKSKG